MIFSKEITKIFKGDVVIINTNSYDNIFATINKSIFNKDLTINKQINKIEFIECVFYNKIIFNEINSRKKNSTNNYYEGLLNFINTSFKEIKFQDFNIGELKIEFTKEYKNNTKLENNIYFYKSLFEKLKIYGEDIDSSPKIGELSFSHFKFYKDSEIFINHLKINKFEFSSVTNLTDSFKITNVSVLEEFNLKDVDFGKIIFNGLNLTNSKLNFKHPTFNSCIFNNVIWNRNCIIQNSNNEELRDIYRQMKFIMDKLGDSITGSKFYRNEMITQRLLIKDSSYSERFVFFFGYYVSNFGQDWLRPLLILFVLNFILWSLNNYCIYIDGILKITEIFTVKYWDNFLYNLTSYISYLTPFRKLVDNPSILDILARIFSAILIYQSAVSMRRKIER